MDSYHGSIGIAVSTLSTQEVVMKHFGNKESTPEWFTRPEYLSQVNIDAQKLKDYLAAGTPSPNGSVNLGKPGQEPKFVGTKFDSEKLRPSLLPIESLEVVTKVLMFGSAKYSDHNWKIVPNARARYIDAAMRHLMAVVREEENDAESGLSHVAHCICCLLFVLWFDIKGQK
jgi:hypothetical protein